jgi:hypothetical protein
MLAAEGKRLIDQYVAWLRESFEFEQGDGYSLINTPFLDPHNDEIQIFVEKNGDVFRLSDDGYTMSDLQDMGLEINTEKREAHVRQILNGFGVHLENRALVVTTTPRDFPQKKHNLIQAILAMHDLAVMGQEQVLQFFVEDVALFLRERGVPFFRGLKVSGKSGFDHHFDFGIPALDGKPESVLQAINSLTRDLATSMAFAVNDVRLLRGPEAVGAYAVINDREARPSEDYLDALHVYGIRTFTWQQRDTMAAELASS